MTTFWTVLITLVVWHLIRIFILRVGLVPFVALEIIQQTWINALHHVHDVSKEMRAIATQLKDVGTETKNNDLKDLGRRLTFQADRLLSDKDKETIMSYRRN